MIEIFLARGLKMLLDEEDKDLGGLKIYLTTGRVIYAQIYLNGGTMNLHRLILSRMLGRHIERGEVCDHINRNGLDNRRENLRLANNAQNMANSGPSKANVSGYKGVSWSKEKKKWRAAINVSGKSIHIGYFADILEAAAAYNEVSIKYYGDFAR